MTPLPGRSRVTNSAGPAGNREKPDSQMRRADVRAAAIWAAENGEALHPAAIRRLVNGYHASTDRDSMAISQWLEVKCANPTQATALLRVHKAGY